MSVGACGGQRACQDSPLVAVYFLGQGLSLNLVLIDWLNYMAHSFRALPISVRRFRSISISILSFRGLLSPALTLGVTYILPYV